MKEKGFELLEKHIKQSIAVSKVYKLEGSEIHWKQIKTLKKSVINKLNSEVEEQSGRKDTS